MLLRHETFPPVEPPAGSSRLNALRAFHAPSSRSILTSTLPRPHDPTNCSFPPSHMHSIAVPPVVTPEGTTAISACSATSVTSLVPLKRRIPQAPVFITKHVPQTSFISDASDPPQRTYCFDDDYPSIAASESTAAAEPTRTHCSSQPPYPRRPSVTGAIRRHISIARRQEDPALPHSICHRFKRTSHEQDSVLEDWKRSRKRSSTGSSHRLLYSQPLTCGAFDFRSLFTRHHRPTHQQNAVQSHLTPTPSCRSPHQEHQKAVSTRALVPDVSRQPNEDLNFMSTLAYEDFMHGRNRPSKSVRFFARLRRS